LVLTRSDEKVSRESGGWEFSPGRKPRVPSPTRGDGRVAALLRRTAVRTDSRPLRGP